MPTHHSFFPGGDGGGSPAGRRSALAGGHLTAARHGTARHGLARRGPSADAGRRAPPAGGEAAASGGACGEWEGGGGLRGAPEAAEGVQDFKRAKAVQERHKKMWKRTPPLQAMSRV